MITCPKCKHEFSEIDQPCKKCKGGCFQWKVAWPDGDPATVFVDPATTSHMFKAGWKAKKTPCSRCNGNGVERSAANRNNRSRGSSNEYKACNTFTEWWKRPDGGEYEFKRTPQSGGSDLAVGWDMAGDVCTNAPDFPFSVECKRDKGWSLEQLVNPTGTRMGEFMDQALGDCPKHRISMLWLMHPGPSQPTFIMMQGAADDAAVQTFMLHPHFTQPGTFTGARMVNGVLVRYIVMSLKHFLAMTPDTHRSIYHTFKVMRGIASV
jgi:hypothetical protein